jgi:hypothetical protein
VCHPELRICVECAEDSDCPAEEPVCSEEELECVGCRTSADCPAERPLCDEEDCVECIENTDCSALEQCEDGFCEVEGESSGSEGEGP